MTAGAGEAELLKAAADATDGTNRPDAAAISSTPPPLALRVLALAGPALSAMIILVLIILAGTGLRIFWILEVVPPVEWPEHVAETRVAGIVAIGMALCATLGVVTFRLASGGLRRVEVSVGAAGLKVESGADEG